MFYLLKLTESILKNIPRRAGYFFSDIFSFFSFLFSGERKRNLKTNLEAVIGPGKVTDAMLLSAYKTYGRYYYDIFSGNIRFPECSDPASDAVFKSEYVPKITEYLNRKQGFIIVSMHLGNWDAAGSYAASYFPGKVNMVVEKLSPAMLKWFTQAREKLGIKIISHTDIKHMIKVLNNGEILVLASDRDIEKSGFQINVFGKKAYIPSGPSKLSLMTAAPMLVGSFPRSEKDITKFISKPHPGLLNTDKIERTKENIEQLTKDIIIEMEELIKQDPLQWCMLQKFFVE